MVGGGARLNTQERACRWGASKRGCVHVEGSENRHVTHGRSLPRLSIRKARFVYLPPRLYCLHRGAYIGFFFHTVQPEVCLSADKEFLHRSIVFFFYNPPAPQTSPPFSFCGLTGGKNLQPAAHQHAKHGTALDLAKWINLDLGCKWAHKCVIANSGGHAGRLVPFSSLLATAAAMFLLRNEVTQATFTDVECAHLKEKKYNKIKSLGY